MYLDTLSESDGKEFKNEDDNLFLDNIIISHYTFNQYNENKESIFALFIKKMLNILKQIKMPHLNQMPNLFLIFLQGNRLIRGIQKS